MIRLNSVSKNYLSMDGRPVSILSGVSFSASRGEFVAVIGHSGSGKTTLLNIIGALDNNYGGEVRLANQDIRGMSDRALSAFRRKNIGFVFQQYNLLSELTALENVLLPSWFASGSDLCGILASEKQTLSDRGHDLLKRVGLQGKENSKPDSLSGGERQRVAIARAMLFSPPILLCDEPTGNLDPETGGGIVKLFQSLCAETGLTALVVTHDQRVSAAAGRVLTLKDGTITETAASA